MRTKKIGFYAFATSIKNCEAISKEKNLYGSLASKQYNQPYRDTHSVHKIKDRLEKLKYMI